MEEWTSGKQDALARTHGTTAPQPEKNLYRRDRGRKLATFVNASNRWLWLATLEIVVRDGMLLIGKKSDVDSEMRSRIVIV